ncbi:DUF4157 domain-containing protein [Floridanema evergladense]|uniref:DUF4157 domain-containing protein n=1 Tax=Floridaenema evergladense BLCC-F167 TaxID=3153639 RepID=A0ABV4WKL4_9CYAN
MSMRSQIQKKPVSSSYSPPAQKATSWQRPFSDPVHDPKQDGTVQSKIAPGAGFNLLQMKLFPDTPTPVQAKLSVGAPGDKYEQQADSVANKVMTMPAPEQEEPTQQEILPEEKKEEEVQTKALSNPTEEPKEEEDLPVQAKAESEGKSSNNGNLESQLNGSKGGGSPLPDEVRAFMEPRFGADFSSVRVHTDGAAVQMNKELGAQAFTHGSDIYYGGGKSPGKDELTAHELTHVVQQNSGAVHKSAIEKGREASSAGVSGEQIQRQGGKKNKDRVKEANPNVVDNSNARVNEFGHNWQVRSWRDHIQQLNLKCKPGSGGGGSTETGKQIFRLQNSDEIVNDLNGYWRHQLAGGGYANVQGQQDNNNEQTHFWNSESARQKALGQ